MVTRKENWPQLLSQYLAERKGKPFAWHENDCLSFTSGCVDLLTGSNFFEQFSDYHDEESAKHLLNANGGVAGIIRQCLGKGTHLIMTAKRGDVAILKMPEIAAGIIDDSGERIAVIEREKGLIRVPITRAIKVWRY